MVVLIDPHVADILTYLPNILHDRSVSQHGVIR